MKISDKEKQRARNLIWNAAQEYHFEPDFKAYDSAGQADLYWNSIFGAARKYYGEQTLKNLFDQLKDAEEERAYEQMLWLGIENAVYPREARLRPALPELRTGYARQVLDTMVPVHTTQILERAHFARVMGKPDGLTVFDRKMLEDLEFSPDWDGQTLHDHALEFLFKWFSFRPGLAEEQKKGRKWAFWGLFGRKSPEKSAMSPFGLGYSEHAGPDIQDAQLLQIHMADKSFAASQQHLKQYISTYFGDALYDEAAMKAREQELCRGEHLGCHLYYAQGSDRPPENKNSYGAKQRLEYCRQMELNRQAYEADALRHRQSILRLTARIQNAMKAYLQPTVVRTASGTLEPGRIWRGVHLNDDKIFTKVLQSDPGRLCVDLLLDASFSQLKRQQTVSAQGYMIAEALNRCQIPVRVSSYCSMSGYTVLTRYRDYLETDKNHRIFHYFTAGCNRDGLAIRAIAREMEEAPCENRMLILLSDAKPYDIIQTGSGGEMRDYSTETSIHNTAMEVRSLVHQNISVICVFTGNDEDVSAAHTIYGRNFARIRHFDQFADTVGTLIQNQIRSF